MTLPSGSFTVAISLPPPTSFIPSSLDCDHWDLDLCVGLPDARLAERRGRRGSGSLAASQPLRHERRGEPGRMADDGRRAGVPGSAALAQGAAGGVAGPARARPDRDPRGRDRPRARSATERMRPRCPTPISPVSEQLSTPSSLPRAVVTSTRSSRCSTLTLCSEPTAQPWLTPSRGGPGPHDRRW
jgi:hypothetical protein